MIELVDVQKSFGANHVIRGFSASVTKGEVVCIIGPSGSGKSTILRCINGLEAYDGGTIVIEGMRVDRADRSIRQIRMQVSMVFQRFNLFPHRTALENVTEGPIYVKTEPREEAERRGRDLLARVGLADKANAYPAVPLRRTAAARRDRASARDGAEGDPVRRADFLARSRTGRRGARRDALAC